MSDEVLVLWELCDHGVKLRHQYNGDKWCAGGREVRLRRLAWCRVHDCTSVDEELGLCAIAAFLENDDRPFNVKPCLLGEVLVEVTDDPPIKVTHSVPLPRDARITEATFTDAGLRMRVQYEDGEGGEGDG